MNISKKQILLFLSACLLLAALLYPNAYFLGYFYEGIHDFAKAEAYYWKYLENHPYSKRGILSLVELYQNSAQPEKITPLLEKLYSHRPGDWPLAQLYLNHLEELHDEEALFELRRRVAGQFLASPPVPKEELEKKLLLPAFQYAYWKQRNDVAYDILTELAAISEQPDAYQDYLLKLDQGLQKTDKVVKNLQNQLSQDPQDEAKRKELISVYLVSGNPEKAERCAREGLQLAPDNIDLLKILYSIHQRQKNTDLMIADLERLIANPKLPPQEAKTFQRDIVQINLKAGRIAEAVERLRQMVLQDPMDKQTWNDLIFTYSMTGEIGQTLEAVQEYLKYFPGDAEKEKLLYEIYLYKIKNTKLLGPYFAYVENSHSQKFAVDVAYLLIDKKIDTLTDWLEKVHQLFPANPKITELLSNALYDQKLYAQALPLEMQLYESEYQPPRTLQRIAEIQQNLKNKKASIEFYEKLAEIKKDDPAVLQQIGQALLYQSSPKKALYFLNKAAELEPKNPETWFWISEIESVNGRHKSAREAAEKVVALLSEKREILDLSYNRCERFECEAGEEENRSVYGIREDFPTNPTKQSKRAAGYTRGLLSPEETRMLLKSEGKIKWDTALQSRYESALQTYPQYLPLRSDYIEALFRHRDLKQAEVQIDQLEAQNVPEEQILPLRARLAFERRNWKSAIQYYRRLTEENPGEYSYRRILGDAYYQNGDWKKALREYETVQQATGNQYRVAETIRDIHEKYDHRAGAFYNFISIGGGDDIMEWKNFYQGYLNQNWKISGEVTLGHFHSSSIGYSDFATYGKVLGGFEKGGWNVRFGTGFGVSDVRSTVSPEVGGGYRQADKLMLDAGYKYRMLRTDLPEAVAAGTLEDIASFRWQYRPLGWFNFFGNYQWSRNYLPDGATGFGNNLETGINFRVLKNPYLTLGYLFNYNKNTGQEFLSQVPLVSLISAHYFTGNIFYRARDNLSLSGGFFVGEDTARNLHLFQGDLWGVRSGIRWGINSWLDFDTRYEFGRQTQFNVPGTYHNLQVGLSGHWR